MNEVIIFITVLATISSVYGNEDIQCEDDGNFVVCQENGTIISVNETFRDRYVLHLHDFRSIAPCALQNLSTEPLNMLVMNISSLTLHSFIRLEGLHRVVNLDLWSINILLEENVFKGMSSLVTLYINSRNIELKKGAFTGLSKLEQLGIPKNNISTIKADTFHGVGSKLRILELGESKISRLEPRSFENFGDLIFLDLSGNQLTDIEPDVFHRLQSLKELSLANNQLTIVRKNWFNHLKRLNNLHLRYNKISVIEAGAFDGLSLKYVDLKYNQLSVIPIGIFHGASVSEFDIFQDTIIEVEDNAFCNSHIEIIHFNNGNVSIDKHIWGLPESAKIINGPKPIQNYEFLIN